MSFGPKLCPSFPFIVICCCKKEQLTTVTWWLVEVPEGLSVFFFLIGGLLVISHLDHPGFYMYLYNVKTRNVLPTGLFTCPLPALMSRLIVIAICIT